ncbi:GNAT family N-acetyltransferase [Roseibium litorale]|uniref:Acetyltransferase n=1 Tax=Roseibium litorale TaxID=2803841 RepID=A0ABR9CSL7_9HYPH|nr:GNAT family N-acetyltransferase [Roseibium litorale]MBD8893277.1 acetyltransferase [Roseibium litorale]
MNFHAAANTPVQDAGYASARLRLAPGNGPALTASPDAPDSVKLLLAGQPFANARLSSAGDTPVLALKFDEADPAPEQVPGAALLALEAVFAQNGGLDRLILDLGHAALTLRDLPFAHPVAQGKDCGLEVRRDGFYQTDQLWLGHTPSGRLRTGFVPGPDGRDHPLRPPHPQGVVYERYDPVADVTVSFRTVDIDRDLDTFHRWMNDGRVAYFWELAWEKPKLRDYLAAFEARPHTYPLIGCFNGEDAGYFETYWVREDRLGPFYDSGPWDRAWHGLIGERKHLGRAKTGAWLRGLIHYLFLDCPMTENIMGEPRVDNAKLLSYAAEVGYEKVGEFDFPHKRSALMRCTRDRFFSEVRL